MQISFSVRQLVCLLCVLASSVAEAQSPASAASPPWLAQELLWASSAIVVAQSSTQSAAPFEPVGLSHADAPRDEAYRQHASLGRQRGRYRTMRVAGYLLAATALVVGLASIPLHMARHDHVSEYGRGSCTPNLFPAIAAAALGSGLTVGILGSVRDRELTQKHGPVVPLRSGWRAALAGLGVFTAMGVVTSSIVTTGFCNS